MVKWLRFAPLFVMLLCVLAPPAAAQRDPDGSTGSTTESCERRGDPATEEFSTDTPDCKEQGDEAADPDPPEDAGARGTESATPRADGDTAPGSTPAVPESSAPEPESRGTVSPRRPRRAARRSATARGSQSAGDDQYTDPFGTPPADPDSPSGPTSSPPASPSPTGGGSANESGSSAGTTPVTPTASETPTDRDELPLTGFSVIALVAGGVVLAAAGLAVRRAA